MSLLLLARLNLQWAELKMKKPGTREGAIVVDEGPLWHDEPAEGLMSPSVVRTPVGYWSC